MPQNYRLSAASRGSSLVELARLSDDEAHARLAEIRFAANGGEPYCPRCGCAVAYKINARRKTKTGSAPRPLYKCKVCLKQFSLTSGTILASNKLPKPDLLCAMKLFADAAKGKSAIEMSHNFNWQYKTLFVLEHKFREALGGSIRDELIHMPLSGDVEVDGTTFGGSLRKTNRRDRARAKEEKEAARRKVQTVVVLRERGGRSVPFVVDTEGAAVPFVREHVTSDSTVYTDQAPCWTALAADFELRRVDHSKHYWSPEGHTNNVESGHARSKRAQRGVHHRMAGKHLQGYADDMAWRENKKLTDGRRRMEDVARAALTHPPSRRWKGVWQRRSSQEDRDARNRLRRRPKRVRH